MKNKTELIKAIADHHLFHILIVFALTTLVGSWLTSEFQKRNWEHQQALLLLEKEKDEAKLVFEQISSLMDRRLYSYRQIHYALHPNSTEKRLLTKLEDYSEVLYDWNERLNTNLAKIELNFGKELRISLKKI